MEFVPHRVTAEDWNAAAERFRDELRDAGSRTELELGPAPGRDYADEIEVLAAWCAGESFIVLDVASDLHHQPIDASDCVERGIAAVLIRYDGLARTMRIDVAGSPEQP